MDADDVVTRVDGARGGDGGVDAAGQRGQHPHRPAPRPARPAEARPAARARATAPGRAASSASTSAAVEVWPEAEPQRAARVVLLDAHREQHVARLRHAGLARRPRRALHARGVEQVEQGVALAAGEGEVGVGGEAVERRGVVVGRRRAAGPVGRASGSGPRRTASGTAARTPRTRSSRSAARRAACSGRCAGRRRRPRRRRTARPAVSSVPERTPRSWPPPCSTGVRSRPRRASSAPIAERAADLVPADRHGVQARGGEVDRHLADRLHGVGVHRDAVAAGERDHLGERLQRADLVVRPHDRHERAASPDASSSRGEGVHVEPALVVHRQQHDLRAGVLRHPERRVEDGVVLDRRRRGSGGAPGPAVARDQNSPLIARLSASVPPAVSTTSLGRAPRAAARVSRDSSTVRRAARPAACRDERCRSGRARWSAPRSPPAASAWSPRGRGRPSRGTSLRTVRWATVRRPVSDPRASGERPVRDRWATGR